MATWEELQNHITAAGLPFDELSKTQISLLFEFPDARQQRVLAAFRSVKGVAWCEITSRVAKTNNATPTQLLIESAALLPGGICSIGDSYLLRQVQALEHTTGAAFEFYLRSVAAAADSLEEKLSADDKF